MAELELLRQSFVALLDGLWWGLRDNVGPLSMHEGYSRGFRQIGIEAANLIGGHGPESAARIAAEIMGAIGLDAKRDGRKVMVHSCPLWNRILERGLEYAFHIEEICWIPLLSGIGEKAGAKAFCDSSLRTLHLEKEKVKYKVDKAKASLDSGKISMTEFERQRDILQKSLSKIPSYAQYRFE